MAKKIKLLLVEDERMLAEILSDTLSDREFEVRIAGDGQQALDMCHAERPDIVVTDIMMPRMDGYTFVKQLRSEGCVAPVLYLTARSTTEDVVKGFETGGNDYLRKPFSIDELIVRIRALVGRLGRENKEAQFRIGNYHFDSATGELSLGERRELLSAREGEVLAYLCRRANQTVETAGMLRELWGDDTFYNLRSLNVFISRLRRRLEDDAQVGIISVRGVGYKLKC